MAQKSSDIKFIKNKVRTDKKITENAIKSEKEV